MFQLISLIRSFLVELFFNSPEEANFKHPKFNIKKWLVYIAVMLSFVVNALAIPRLAGLAVEHHETILGLESCTADLKAHIEEHHFPASITLPETR